MQRCVAHTLIYDTLWLDTSQGSGLAGASKEEVSIRILRPRPRKGISPEQGYQTARWETAGKVL